MEQADSSSILGLQGKQEFKTTHVFKSVEPFVDLGNLLVEDLDPFDFEQYKQCSDNHLKLLARDNVQYLFNKIWELPTERVEDVIVVKLPESLSLIPREKPIPKLRDATRWERYAKLKGIQKMKKSKMVWSDETQSWQPRYGYKRAKDGAKDWIVEIPRQSDPYQDYIGEKIDKKKEGVAKNELQRLKNIRNEQSKTEEYPGLPPEQKSSEHLARQLNRATNATASLGKFTDKFKDEKRPKNSGKKRQFLPNENTVISERKKQIEILKRLQSKNSSLDVEKAAGNFTQENQNLAATAQNNDSTSGSKMRKPQSRAGVRKKSRARKGGQQRNAHSGKRNRAKGKK